MDEACKPNADEPIRFAKYHGLGNDYLVVEPADLDQPLTPGLVRFLCDHHYGVGGDGLLSGPLPSQEADFGLRIYNPDGTEAEKSGNGLRIFARHLWEKGRVGEGAFRVETPGGIVTCQVETEGGVVQVEMGKASFEGQQIPLRGIAGEAVDVHLQVGELTLRCCALSLGNPHCVVLDQPATAQTARHWGPQIENAPWFPRRTNVQFLEVIDRRNLRIEIWERGAGYTLASGSSACAAVSAAYRLGWCEAQVRVHMPGGAVQVSIAADGMINLRGAVTRVCRGEVWLEGFNSWVRKRKLD